jgi:hypothetical protein
MTDTESTTYHRGDGTDGHQLSADSDASSYTLATPLEVGLSPRSRQKAPLKKLAVAVGCSLAVLLAPLTGASAQQPAATAQTPTASEAEPQVRQSRSRSRTIRLKKIRGERVPKRLGPLKITGYGRKGANPTEYSDIVAALGKPHRTKKHHPFWTTVIYKGRFAATFQLVGGGEPVLQGATLTGKGWRTSKGIRVGSSMKALLRKYPSAWKTSPKGRTFGIGGRYYHPADYYYSNLEAIIRGGKVHKIVAQTRLFE